MRQFRFWTLFVAAGLLSASAFAAEKGLYKAEIGLRYDSIEQDGFIDHTDLAVDGEYFFKPLTLADRPWQEAAFMGREISIRGILVRRDLEAGNADSDGFLLGGGGTYTAKDVPVALGIDALFGSADGDGVDYDFFYYSAFGGFWVMPTAQIGIRYTFDGVEINNSDFDRRDIFLYGKVVKQLQGRPMWFNAEVELGQSNYDLATGDDSNIMIMAGGDFYFSQQAGLGAFVNFENGDAEPFEGIGFGIRGSIWITENVGIQALLSMFEADSSTQGVDEDRLFLRAAVRF